MPYHTLEIYRSFVDSDSFWALFRAIEGVTDCINTASIYLTKTGAYRCTLLDEVGIRITMLKRNETYHRDMLYVVFNPQRLKDINEFTKLTKGSEYPTIEKMFKKILNPIRKEFVSKKRNKYFKFDFDLLNTYQTKRFDPCVDIRSPHKDNYMELLKRANAPNGFTVGGGYDDSSHRWKPYDDGFYLIRERSINISIYDKYSQLSRKHSDYEKIEEAKDIIRFEVQCLIGKTNYMKHAGGWENKSLTHYIDEETCLDTLLFYYKKVVGFGDYYTIAEAKVRIYNNGRLRNDTKRQMIEVLELINIKRGIWRAKPHYKGEPKEFECILKKINKEGINPVTIPVNWEVSHLPNLVNEIVKEFTPNRK